MELIDYATLPPGDVFSFGLVIGLGVGFLIGAFVGYVISGMD